jgi:hypothetical protein
MFTNIEARRFILSAVRVQYGYCSDAKLRHNCTTMILCSICEIDFLETNFLRESPPGINFGATVWSDPFACKAIRIQTRHHTWAKGVVKEVQDNICCVA